MVRHMGANGASFNRNGANSNPTNADQIGSTPTEAQDYGCHCIADRCMMWRWEHTTASVPVVKEGSGGSKYTTYEQRTVRTHGYCGLAPLPATTSM